MTGTVRYRTSGDNSVLRYALYEAWSMRCYWCSKPQEYNQLQIDHIIPKTVEAARLKQLVADYALPADFDVHDPYNLAPICTPCNGPGTKGSADHTATPIVLSRLKKAANLRGLVIHKVQTFPKSGELAKALVDTVQIDLRNQKARETFEDYAPALVQKLALLGEDKVQNYVVLRYIEITPEPFDVGVSLDAGARRAVTILEDVCGGSLDELLTEPLRELYDEIHTRVQGEMEAKCDASGVVAHPDGRVRIDVDDVHFSRQGGAFNFTFEGSFEADLSASVVEIGEFGDGEHHMQGDAGVEGKLELVVRWDAPDVGDDSDPYVLSYDLTSWEGWTEVV